MTKNMIDRNLLSNKQSCYIFDIDGCLANVDHLILTKKQAYEAEMINYQRAYQDYMKDLETYNYDLVQYEQGLIKNQPYSPIVPVKPEQPAEKDEKRMDWVYFYKHIKEAQPISAVIDLFVSLALTKKVIILTARNISSKQDTIDWLQKAIAEKYGDNMYRRINFQLIFKADNSECKGYDSSVEFKKEKVLELAKDYNIQLLIEDHPKIIEEYTKLGLFVLSPNREYIEIKA